jgi:hypothetical protein
MLPGVLYRTLGFRLQAKNSSKKENEYEINMYHKRLNWLCFFAQGKKKLTKSLSWLCFLPKGKKSHFTPYNQGVKLLIIQGDSSFTADGKIELIIN